ncbi:hypothetical protein ACEPAF_3054 [Sanghuangporus sanghuang]
MADIEKHGNGGSVGHPGAPNQGTFPMGAGGTGGPPTLGASGVQQHFYQGGLPLRTFANPAPLGLFSFASTTFILSLVNVNARGVSTPNVVVGMALACGGLAQLLAGMWEFAAGNTFGATAFSSYGAFWISWAVIEIPDSGVIAAYDNEDDLANALGFYLAAWFMFTFMMLIASLRSNAGLISLFFFLTLTFMFLMIAEFTGNNSVHETGGGFGIVTAAIAYYCACANLFSRDSSFVSLPLLPIPKPRTA